MRVYSAADEEALTARSLLKDWAAEGFIGHEQYGHMERDTVCDLRRTNIFLRLVLFLFTLLVTGAAVALFFTLFLSHPDARKTGVFLMIFGAVAYAGAEIAISQARLYRYGIEEALAACAVGLFCAGLQTTLFGDRQFSAPPSGTEFLVPAAGALASLWIWRRFGLSYAFPAAMIFAIGIPAQWTSSHSAQHLIVAGFYAAGLIAVITVRFGDRLVEAFLWMGIYLALNLQLGSFVPWWLGSPRLGVDFGQEFYWGTWIVIWCLPAAILTRGIRSKARPVMAAGAIAAVLTLVTNKPYLGWTRQSWDPMLLGAVMIGTALLLRRWLARGPGGVRNGFTALRLSGRDKHWIDTASAAFGVVAPNTFAAPQGSGSEVRFGGGDSAGGGASSDF